MPLDLAKLINVRSGSNGARTAGCPACLENGADHSRDHLIIYSDGRFGCIANQGDEIHRKRIWALAGDGSTGSEESQISQIAPQLQIERTWPASVLDRLIKDHSYWVNRGVKESVLIDLRGGVATEGQMKGRYVFGIPNERGELIGFTGRAIDSRNPVRWKHLGKVSSWVWADLDEICRQRRAILVEGAGCRASLMSHGYDTSLVLWGTSLSHAVLGVLIATRPIDIVIATNRDIKHEVGQVAASKIKTVLDKFFNPEVTRIVLPIKKDFLDMTTESDWNEWKNRLEQISNNENS